MTLILVYTLSKTILGHSFFNYILVFSKHACTCSFIILLLYNSIYYETFKRDVGRVYESGATKNKKKELAEVELRKQSGALDKYLCVAPQRSSTPQSPLTPASTQPLKPIQCSFF